MTRMFRLKIIKPGLLSTIQDQGREAYREFGIPQSGPMDPEAAILANSLLGNPETNPVMEFTLSGPVIELEGEGWLVITGGQFEAKLDNKSIPGHQVIAVKGTQTLSIGRAIKGCRGYLAVAGNWKLSKWLESCSTSPQDPENLTPESVVKKGAVFQIDIFPAKTNRSVEFKEPWTSSLVRILAGPEYHRLGAHTIRGLLSGRFTVSSDSNRMGYRLNEPLYGYHSTEEIISSAVVPGTVQVTPAGKLMVLMNDAQTTGGYPRIAQIISADLGIVGQKRPGDQIGFKLVSLEEAYAATNK